MGSKFSKLAAWYNKHIKHEREPAIKLIDPVFHHHKIKTYGIELRDPELPLEDRATAACYIGLLTYTGGVNAALLASEYIQDMINILLMPDTSGEVRTYVLKGLCGICYLSYLNQNEAKDRHLMEILLAYLDEDEDPEDDDPLDIITMKLWVCYLMTVVCCNNIPYLKLFNEVGGQKLRKSLEALSKLEWFSWPQNYAKLMLALLAYQEQIKESLIGRAKKSSLQ
ncbi:armadillo-like helical domain-containing protein 2 [Podarcis raffonei]|uniref:armadillo-like helical domain-containing protein 2 n=1 Tax=Podarcis raffonei TaxID=65483 RepID=UPI00232918A4|nr:armadillo-like helical domain-containing protein 2 [Podarcis raffonei]